MVERITSRQNARVKDVAKLRSARQRLKQGRFIIDGEREIARALDARIRFLEVFVCPELYSRRLPDTAATVAEVTPAVWAKLNFGQRDDGLVVVAETPERRLDQLRLPRRPLVAVLEGLEKPGNVGAVLRTADGAGVDAVIVADPRTDLFNPNTIRASLGAVFAPHVCTAGAEQALEKLREWQLPIVAARPEGARLYSDFDFRQGAAIVLGSEAHGLSEVWQGEKVTSACLPMQGIADSLNVSATAAVMFYEALRQRAS